MERIILYFLFILIYFIANVLFSKLLSKITPIKTNWKTICFMCLIISSYATYSSKLMPISPMITYILLTLLYVLHLFISFKGSIILKLSCAFIVVIHLLAISIIIWSVIALIIHKSMFYILNTPGLLMSSRLISMIFCCIEIVIILKTIKLKYLKLIRQHTHRLNILFAIVSFLAFTVIINTIFFSTKITASEFFLQQLYFGICIIGILYTSLFMMIGYEIMEDKRKLLYNVLENHYKSMLFENKLLTIEINCNEDKIINYIYRGNIHHEIIGQPYNSFLPFLNTLEIHKEDRKNFYTATCLTYMMDLYNKGVHKYQYECRFFVNNDYQCHRVNISFIECDDLVIAMLIVENIQKNKDLIFKAEREGLTSLYNKISTEKLISDYIENNKDGVIFMIDLDNFKAINDNLGHDMGDKVLKEISMKLNMLFPDSDVIGRIGGDEFIVYFKNNLSDINKRALELCKKITKTYSKNNINITISASIGIARVSEVIVDFAGLYQCADIAMYESKKHGKNTFTIYEKIPVKTDNITQYYLI
ncbi:hypothetical protein AN641_10125 [Candidatus Epulonipiscioides gigas]|nr:hypothetical protein AN641_10125 [Epulopiscium sp. SCG-C07WGA-EpuloA2]